MSDMSAKGPQAGGNLDRATVAAEELRAAAEDMEEAAWQQGILPGEPLGIWVMTMRRTLVLLGGAVTGAVADARALAEAEVTKLHEARLAAEAELKKATTVLHTLEIQKVTLTSEMVKVIAPDLREELKQAVVIKERRHNRHVEWGRALATGALVLGLVAGGYVLGTWDDSTVNAAVVAVRGASIGGRQRGALLFARRAAEAVAASAGRWAGNIAEAGRVNPGIRLARRPGREGIAYRPVVEV